MQNDDHLLISRSTLEEMLERASEAGAMRALEKVGLHDNDAIRDILELRSVLESYRVVKRVALKTIAAWITTGILGLIAIGAATKNWLSN